MGDGVQVFRSDGRKDFELHSFISRQRISDIIRPSINGYVMAPSSKTCGKLLRKSFKPALVCRDAAGSNDGQFHEVAIIDYSKTS